MEGLREGLYLLPHQALSGQLEAVVERTEDFTDSAYTSHEHREGILQLCQLARQDTDQLITAWMEAVCGRSQGIHAHINTQTCIHTSTETHRDTQTCIQVLTQICDRYVLIRLHG